MSPSVGAEIATAGGFPRVTVAEAPPLPNAFEQETAIVFAPSCNATEFTAALAVFAPPAVQVVPAGTEFAPSTVNATFRAAAFVFDPFKGVTIATAGTTPRVAVAEALSAPNAFAQATVTALSPSCSGTGLTVALSVFAPFTVHVVPAGIVLALSTVYVTFTDDAVVCSPFAGAVTATVGGFPLNTTTDWESLPRALEQVTVIVFAPSISATLFVVALAVDVPSTLHVVPAGIDPAPSTRKATFTLDAVVLRPVPGAVTTTDGPEPRTTVTDLESAPNAFEHATAIVFEPIASATALEVESVVPAPFTVQLVPAGIEAAPFKEKATFTVAAEVRVLSVGVTIVTTGAIPRVTVTDAPPLPKSFVQETVRAFAPMASAT